MHKYTVMPAQTLSADFDKENGQSPARLLAGRGTSEDKLRFYEVTSGDFRKTSLCDPTLCAAQGSAGVNAGWRLAALLSLLSTVLAFGLLFHERNHSGRSIVGASSSPSDELLQRLEAFERDASAERDARAGMERRQQVELQKLKESEAANAKEQQKLRTELSGLRHDLHDHSAEGQHVTGHDQSELAVEVRSLRKALDAVKDDLAKETRGRKTFQGELKESEKVTEDNLPCRDAVIGEKCFKNVVWAKTEGVRIHPDWYSDLTEDSSFKEFQMVLHKNGLYDCRKPCKGGDHAKDEDDQDKKHDKGHKDDKGFHFLT